MVSSAIWKKSCTSAFIFEAQRRLQFKLTSDCFSNCTRKHTRLLFGKLIYIKNHTEANSCSLCLVDLISKEKRLTTIF